MSKSYLLIANLLLATAAFLDGCATGINVIEQSSYAEQLIPSLATENVRPVAFVNHVALKSDGVERTISNDFIRQVQYKLRESELFSDVTFQKPWGKPATLNLSVEEARDDHAGSNFAKQMLAAVTLLLLAPVLPLHEESRMNAVADVTWPGGQTKQYRAVTNLEVHYNALRGGLQAKRDLYATTVNRTLNSLVSQMVTDEDRLALTKLEPRTLHTGSRVRYGIWTDNKKWRRVESSPPKDMNFKHLKGDAFATVVAERIQVPLETMKRTVVANAGSGLADLVVTESTTRNINGHDILHIRMHGKSDGVPLEYIVYVISDERGTIQLFTYTGGNLISEFENDFLEFLNGFVLDPT